MKQGDIWLIDLNPTVGAEIRKTRPATIVNDNAVGKLPLKIIVPLTDWKSPYQNAPWMVKVEPNKTNNQHKSSSADCFQVRSLSEDRFVKRIGTVNKLIQSKIQESLAMVLSVTP